MHCKLKYLPRDWESCQPRCQKAASPWWFLENAIGCFPGGRTTHSWITWVILNGLFPFPHNCPLWLMGLEGIWTYKMGFELGIQLHWHGLWQNGSFPPSSNMFFVFSTSSAKLPFSICRKRYIIWRSRAKYLIWMIMLQVSHQDCSVWITNYFSSTSCLLQGAQSMAGMMRDGSNKWGPGQLMPWAGWRTRNSKDNAISGQRSGWAPSNRLTDVAIGATMATLFGSKENNCHYKVEPEMAAHDHALLRQVLVCHSAYFSFHIPFHVWAHERPTVVSPAAQVYHNNSAVLHLSLFCSI